MVLLKSFLFLVVAVLFALSHACPLQIYSPEALQAAQKNNQMIVLHFFKMGCHTCHVQTEFLKGLKSPPLCQHCKDIVIFEVDVDEETSQPLMISQGVATPAILIALQGEQSLGRVVGETHPDALLRFVNDTTKCRSRIN